MQAGTLGEIIPELDELAEKIARYAHSGAATGAPPVAAGPPASGKPAAANGVQLKALEGRVEALERVVFSESQAADAPAPDSQD